MRAILYVGLGLFGILGIRPVSAGTYSVPGDFATIQAAVDVAAAGDTVLVGAGTWTGETRTVVSCTHTLSFHSVIFLKRGITVIGTAGRDATILDAGSGTTGTPQAIMLTNQSGPACRVQGFTLTGGLSGVAHGCADTPLEVVACRITGNAN